MSVLPRFKNPLFVILLFGLLLACDRERPQQTYFPEVGGEAIRNRALDLRYDLSIMSIALEPGFEDLETLAYYRLHRGASIMSAYVSNGENRDSDIRVEYPNYRAATRREEAYRALSFLDGDHYFLNLPHLVAAADSEQVRNAWPAKQMRSSLKAAISRFKPDIIIVARDRDNVASLKNQIVLADVLAAVGSLAGERDADETNGANGVEPWKVERVFVDRPGRGGLALDVDELHTTWKKSYRAIAEEAAQAYRSIAVQRQQWKAGAPAPAYELVRPEVEAELTALDNLLPVFKSQRLGGMARRIDKLTDPLIQGKTDGAAKEIADLLEAVTIQMGNLPYLSAREKRALYGWKKGLDELACTLNNVQVKYEISDTALTTLQLSFLTIKEVQGLSGGGETSVFFGSENENWVIDESLEKKRPLKINQPYNLLSPQELPYNTPQAKYGYQSSQFRSPLMFFVIHRADEREKSFIHRSVIDMSYSPRFIVEVLTPIVRIGPQERIDVRLTNRSRDGVRDTLRIEHELAASPGSAFRLSNKDDSHMAKLYPYWKQMPLEGSYLLPIEIDGRQVGNFVARQFGADADTSRRVGYLTGLQESALDAALRRLYFNARRLDATKLEAELANLDVLIIDRRALTLLPQLAAQRSRLDAFARNGGHLVVMAQDDAAWQQAPLIDKIALRKSDRLAENLPLALLDNHRLLTSPNEVLLEEFDGWLNQRGYNEVVLQEGSSAEILIRTETEGRPLLISESFGQGRKTYIELALTAQLLNVHPGSYRLLANLLSQ